MKVRVEAVLLACLAVPFLAAPEAEAQAPTPHIKLSGIHMPTHFAPGTAKNELLLVVTNIGGAAAAGTLTLTDTLPQGLKPTAATARSTDPASPDPKCAIVAQTVTCTNEGLIRPGYQLQARIAIEAGFTFPEGLSDEATLSGGAETVSVDTTATISPTPAPFGFLPLREGGSELLLTESDGNVATQAGSHLYQLTASLGFPTEKSGAGSIIGADNVRDVIVDLPRGLIVNPNSTPVLCTEAELSTLENPGCPATSQVGQITLTTVGATPEAAPSPLFNMVPPPGTAAQLAFDALDIGVFIHLKGEVRSDGDYGLSGATADALALPLHPVFGAKVELWGDPSSALHDDLRGKAVEPQKTAQLSLPGECSGEPTKTSFKANSWLEPEVFHEDSYESADLSGTPTEVEGCNQLEFEPSVEATPTTNLADSPSGLEFELHQPQNMDLGGLSTAALKDALVALPEGLVVNPSAAQGQEACTPAQIGLTSGVGQSPVRFSKIPDTCPDAAKIGTLEVETPLLAHFDESGTKAQRDPEGNVIPRPLQGNVFLAEPFQNPFGSLLAIYFSIEDPRSGTVAKFATKVSADSVTGQLTNSLTEGPQLPLEDFRLSIFKGPRAALRTPPACSTYTTNTDLTPWSAPQTPNANPSDSFQITGDPDGGDCPTSAASGPNQPAFVAGTIAPQAGAYSPFVLKVSREDATQPIGGFEATLPPGLTAKLAGIPACSEAQIAQVQSRSNPNEGAIEKADPSCPAASELGTVNVAAGAGPTPLNTTGRVYLAGPYKGAPISVVIVTPAIAGAFDLGAVVVRTALYVDPATAQVRAVSDPLPTILEGIPLDLRSATVRLDRPEFTLNPTSCDPMTVGATATSVFNQPASLSSPFQVGGCSQLPFKPKLALRLKGGTKRGAHPKLIATLKAKAGEANIAATSVQLPRSAFLDQAHIRTVCTRVQFAASTCPKGSVYGKASARTPLLDYELKGNVYLRSSSNELPDLLIDLRGPEHQPFRVELAGRTDAVKGALRNTFDVVPDAPVSSFRLELFGGSKGLVINSRNLCARNYRAKVRMRGQNGKRFDSQPVVKSGCKKKQRKRNSHRR